MGKDPETKRTADNMKVLCGIFLLVFVAFVANSFAQTNLDALENKIRSGNIEQKRDALLEIRSLQSREASFRAIPALRDADEIVRATAAFAVIYMPKYAGAAMLAPLLNDESELVRRETAYAFGKMQNQVAVNRLLQLLQSDKIPEVRNACIIALGEIGDVSAIDSLTKILQKQSNEKEEFSRRSAARSIGQIAQPKYPNSIETSSIFRAAVTVLIQTLQNQKESSDVKREAAFALGAIGDRSAIPVLQANINDKDYYLAEICKEALKKISR